MKHWKQKNRNEEAAKRQEEGQATLVEPVKRVKETEVIESDSSVQQIFRSSKKVKKSVGPTEVQPQDQQSHCWPTCHDNETDPAAPTASKHQDNSPLAHLDLLAEKADAEEKWFKRLSGLQQERLVGQSCVSNIHMAELTVTLEIKVLKFINSLLLKRIKLII